VVPCGRPPGRRRRALEEGEYELKLVAASSDGSAQAAPLGSGGGVVILDTEVTPELAAEGLARDVIRVVQQARRDASLDVADRISLVLEVPPAVAAAVETPPRVRGGRDAGHLGRAGPGRGRRVRGRGRRRRRRPGACDAGLRVFGRRELASGAILTEL
jgi:hypothetical protein